MDNIEISDKSIHIFSGVDLDILDAPSWLPKANFSRTETDLIATRNNGEDVKFVDYFTNHNLPSIQTENGLLLKGSLLDALAGSLAPGQYVQATGGGTLSIGEVSSIKGVAKATRIDGNIFTLSNGDPVFKGDVIETEGSGSVGLVFLDKTTMSLSDGGKMVLDELVYDPSTGAGSMAVDMLEGAFSFVSGEIAKTGPDAMSVSTPVATIGIRGTTVAGKAAVEGNDNSFTLLQDAEGGVGQISITNSAGTQTLSEVGATTTIASFNIAPPPPIILTAAQIQADYGTALAVLPPTPAVAPQPQAPPLPQEQQQEQQQEEEAATEEEEEGEEAVAEEVASEEGGEEELVEGELGPDGELLAEGEEGLGTDGEPLVEGDEGLGPDGEPLAEGEEGLGPDGEVLEESVNEDVIIEETDSLANETFETALADGVTPEQAMAETVETEGFDNEFDIFDEGTESNSLAIGENLPGDLFGDLDGPLNDSFAGSEENITGGLNSEFSILDDSIFSGELLGSNETNSFNDSSISGFGSSFEQMNLSPDNSFLSGGIDSNIYGGDISIGGFDPVYETDIVGGGFGSETYFGGLDISYSINFGLDLALDSYSDDSYIDYYFEDPSLYEDSSDDTSYAEENETSSTLTGTESADTLVGGDEGITIEGLGGADTITGGLGDDVIKGGEGADFIKGGGGNDQFYYGSISEAGDTIYDFDNGDSVLIDYLPTHSTYGRSGYYQTSSRDFSFDVAANHDVIPLVWNFTSDFDNIPNGDYRTPVEVSKHIDMDFTNYDHTLYDDYVDSVATISDYLIITGDNNGNSAIFLWEDNDHDTSFFEDDTELTLLGILDNYDNDNITSSDITFTISS